MTKRKPSGRGPAPRPFSSPPPDAGRLQPHSLESERGVLGCILLSPWESMNHLTRQSAMGGWFYDLRHQTLFGVLAEMHVEKRPIDLTTVFSRLKDQNKADGVGGIAYLSELMDAVPSPANLPYYLEDVHRLWRLRTAIQAATRLIGEAHESTADVDGLLSSIDSTLTLARAGMTEKAKPLEVMTCRDLLQYRPPPGHCLVGDNEIRKGTEGLAVIAGPGGSGKSLVVAALALGGAIGHGEWMGRVIHRQFKTLLVQCENGPSRLQKEVKEMAANHPGVDLDGHIFFTKPPERGLRFGQPDFDKYIRELVETLGIDLVVIDPWSHLAVKDESCEVANMLAAIRNAVGGGDNGPSIMILAHTKKPRPEDVGKQGRSLKNLVAGSVCLTDTSRCTYILLPWTDEMTDPRIYWTCAKLNDGANYAPSVWQRRFGTFFAPDPTDPKTWGERPEGDREERKAVSKGQLRELYGERMALDRKELVAELVKREWASYQTARRITGPDGYLLAEEWLKETPNGLLALQR